MIRIGGGQLRGQQIYCPKGKDIRPTTSLLRESLFNILSARLGNARFLDLFAGCGIVGIEALSRGAQCVIAVEKVPAHCRILEKNRDRVSFTPEQYQIICQDVFQWIKRLPLEENPKNRFDLIFLDPPYALEGVFELVEMCFEKKLLSQKGMLVWESGRQITPNTPTQATLIDARPYGTSLLSFFQFKADAGEI